MRKDSTMPFRAVSSSALGMESGDRSESDRTGRAGGNLGDSEEDIDGTVDTATRRNEAAFCL